ncbi:MAG: OsmC family protein [Bdellovibrio sp.]
MIQYPLSFQVEAQTEAGIQQTWQTQTLGTGDSLRAAIPPEFQGPGGGYSPEDFYALALANCFVATFKVFAEKSKLAFSSLKISLKLEVDRNEKGAPWMSRAHLQAHLKGVESEERALHLLQKTSQSCLVLNSVKTEKSFDFQVEA